jgi:hypothetical protein
MNEAPLEKVLKYVRESTVVYRNGEVVKEADIGGVHVITIDNFPALPEGLNTAVDCHFVHVGFTEGLAALTHLQFYEMIIDAREGAFQMMELADWARGPSYIEVGRWIGDQTDAFMFMACCVAHGLVKEIITPERLHIPEAQRDAAAGNGYILLPPLIAPEPKPIEAISDTFGMEGRYDRG